MIRIILGIDSESFVSRPLGRGEAAPHKCRAMLRSRICIDSYDSTRFLRFPQIHMIFIDLMIPKIPIDS